MDYTSSFPTNGEARDELLMKESPGEKEKEKKVDDEDEDEWRADRAMWTNKVEYLLSTVGYILDGYIMAFILLITIIQKGDDEDKEWRADRPMWTNKVEYLLSTVGYILDGYIMAFIILITIIQKGDDEDKEWRADRPMWTNKVEYLLSTVGYILDGYIMAFIILITIIQKGDDEDKEWRADRPMWTNKVEYLLSTVGYILDGYIMAFIILITIIQKEDKEEEEEEEWRADRTMWTNKAEYLLSTVGYSVGVGNLVRFPYVCIKNGGGAFLIPFVLSLFLIGLPLFALEVVLGQFSGRNAFQAWAICPLFKGAGLAMTVLSTMACWYYNTILVWAFYYLVSSFQSQLPWSSCDGSWNTDRCFTYQQLDSASANASLTGASANASLTGLANMTASILQTNESASTVVSAAEEFYQRKVLQLSPGFEEPGHVVWYLALALAFTLFVCFVALFKGVFSSGKVAIVTATAPYILITILLIRGATLPGAVDGVIYYLKPDWNKLLEPQVWVEAALQVFFSLGPGWGGLVVMASYNKFNNNCLKDAFFVTVVSELTSIYGGFAIFSVLGHMAHVSGLSIDKVVSSGPGLTFIVYPEAISLLPLPQLWAVLFFLMIITLCLDSQITNAEVELSVITEIRPRLLHHRRPLVTAVFCVFCFVASLPFVTQGGVYIFQLVDWYIATLSVTVIGIIECLVVGWIYGVTRFENDIVLMMGRGPPVILKILWRFVTPAILTVLLGFTFFNYKPPRYGDYQYGVGATVFGWSVALASFIPIPIVAVYQLWIAKGSLTQRIRHTLKPDYKIWAPSDSKVRRAYLKEVAQNGSEQNGGPTDV